MQVKDILEAKKHEVITAARETTVPDAMELLISNKISCLPVVGSGDQLMGIISDKDIFSEARKDPTGFTGLAVSDLMTENVIVGLEDDEIAYIAGIMTNNRIRHVPIVREKKLIGLVSVGDVVKTQMESMQIENRYLKQYIGGDYPA